jgi:hypothetical protein
MALPEPVEEPYLDLTSASPDLVAAQALSLS